MDRGGRPDREVPTRRSQWEESFTPLNKRRAQILKEVMNTQIIKRPPPNSRPMGSEAGLWCEYHRTQGHDTDNCRTLKMHIEKLIQEGHLGRYVQGRGGSNHDKRAAPSRNTSRSPKRGRGKEKAQHKEVEGEHERRN